MDSEQDWLFYLEEAIKSPYVQYISFKGAPCSFGEDILQMCYIYNTNEVVIQTWKYVFLSITE